MSLIKVNEYSICPQFPLQDHFSGGLGIFSRIAWEREYIITLIDHSFTLQSLQNMIEKINRIYSEIISNAEFISYFMIFFWKLD